MKKLLLLLCLIPACKGSGTQDVALGVLTAERAYDVVLAYRDCMEQDGLNKSDGGELRRMLDELLFYVATMDAGDGSVGQIALGLTDSIVQGHDACIDSDDRKTPDEKADAKRRSAQLVQLVRKLVDRFDPQPDPEPAPEPVPELDSAATGV